MIKSAFCSSCAANVPITEFRSRRNQIAREITDRKLDAFLVTEIVNVRYLSGFTGSSGILLLSAEDSVLFTDPRYLLQAGQESDCRVRILRGALLAGALQQIRRKRWKRLGFEANRIGYAAWQHLREQLPVGSSLEPLAGVVERRRMVKSDAEVGLIRSSVLTNSRAYERSLRAVKTGITERELAAEIDHQMRLQGADGPAFETIVAAGARSALPHARPTGNPLSANQLLLVDMGASQNGYASDMTRVVFTGRPAPKARRLYRAVLEAQLAAIGAVRDGVTAASVDREARRVLAGHGLDKAFLHSTGHGLGLEIHEPPRLGRKEKTRLQAGMVVTIEPGAYLEGFGGVRIEDTVLVTGSGCEVLTPTSKDLLVL
jgi:Xaa-Pro aminopeptidase